MNQPEAATLFLSGDVMLGRGVDQILPHSCPPALHERYVRSALGYARLAEAANGPIPAPVDDTYVWGDALAELDRIRPQARIINLETAVTLSEDAARKRIHYRMHPANAPVLTAAAIDCCVLSNNHVLDWGLAGLVETLNVLSAAGMAVTGAGIDREAARAPARSGVGQDQSVLVFGFGATDSGIPVDWGADSGRAGVNVLTELSSDAVAAIAAHVREVKRPGDLAIASIHWGANWSREGPPRLSGPSKP